jgi:7-cyano-7-deazaguanine synthase in queuosine biosynthesis
VRVSPYQPRIPTHLIDVVESRRRPRRGRSAFDLTSSFGFSTAALQSYAFAKWEPVLYDAMVVAASIEYADRTHRRPQLGWRRDFELQIPVLDPSRWTNAEVRDSLRDAASFLTGDSWTFQFVRRAGKTPEPPPDCLPFDSQTDAVVAFSDGMDSRAVARLAEETLGKQLVRVRVGSKAAGLPTNRERAPFTTVPYSVTTTGETSARSRGFKFALISGLAAHLAGADEVLLTESGQGVFGPAIVPTAHAYADYRSHPQFTSRMERFVTALLKAPITFVFPRLFSTKGETLRAFAAIAEPDEWRTTRSCWRNSRHCSLDGRLMQCGVCAACMLRRMSIHAAGLEDDSTGYLCQSLAEPTLDAAMNPRFTRMNSAFRDYAIAGAQHLDQMAALTLPTHRDVLRRHAIVVAPYLRRPTAEVDALIVGLFERHANEWRDFLASMGPRSFIRRWTRGVL